MSIIADLLAVFGLVSMFVFAFQYWVLFVPSPEDREDHE